MPHHHEDISSNFNTASNTSKKTSNQTITEYMQNIITVVDELAILGKKLDQEDITDVVINGLDPYAYKPILDVIQIQ